MDKALLIILGAAASFYAGVRYERYVVNVAAEAYDKMRLELRLARDFFKKRASEFEEKAKAFEAKVKEAATFAEPKE